MTVIDMHHPQPGGEDIFKTREVGPVHKDIDIHLENQEWLESLDYLFQEQGADRVREMLRLLANRAFRRGISIPFITTTPYINTIPLDREVPYPGDREIERRIKSIVRWNALAMVVKANRDGSKGVGGHISTYASAATLYEVGYNHFFRGRTDKQIGDQVYFQGHASPGMYARAFVEGRIDKQHLQNFRQELSDGGGLSSYPHPWLMPDFWQFPTVSMGLGPIQSIYQARFNRYLQDRGLLDENDSRVWSFVGDGECDEPETLGSISLAGREKLDNLIWVINCNLQRLDGPVRGNGKIIQELETVFRGAGWHVVKVVWGSSWDKLIARDRERLLVRRFNETVDGDYQKYSVESGGYIRQHFFGKYPELLRMVEDLSDQELVDLKRGGLDPLKVYNAYRDAVITRGRPTVILAKTVKGYGLGEAGEGRNIAHQQKKINEEELRAFRDRFTIPVTDEELHEIPFYRPPDDSPEMQYVRKAREKLGGYVPARITTAKPIKTPGREFFAQFFKGSEDKEASTTMVFSRILASILADKEIGKYVVPIIPDEARTFGLDALFAKYGIYSHIGQLYEPVDRKQLTFYLEKKDGQILEEGITEAGSMCSFIAAGTSYATYGVTTMPFYIYYSMFGFQRIGDLIWAAADQRARGFLLGGTAGRTTLNGEGLQHQDGHSHILASTVPNIRAYDPAFAFELAIIIQDGMKRMFEQQEDVMYYVTLGNEPYVQLPMPEGVEEGILEGLYRFRTGNTKHKLRANIIASFGIMNNALAAQRVLDEKYGVCTDVWSATSYKQLRYGAIAAERWNMLHPGKPRKVSYLEKTLDGAEGPFVAVSDSMRLVPDQVAKWIPGGLLTLGTDGFGRSDGREELRRFFEISADHIVVAVLSRLAEQGKLDAKGVQKAIGELGIDAEQEFSLFR